MTVINISRDDSGRITLALPYNQMLVIKVKTIEGTNGNRRKNTGVFPIQMEL